MDGQRERQKAGRWKFRLTNIRTDKQVDIRVKRQTHIQTDKQMEILMQKNKHTD